MREFVFPLNLQDLKSRSKNDSYYVEEVYSTRQIPIKFQDVKVQFAREGGVAILQHFDYFYSVLYNYKDLNSVNQLQSWSVIIKGFETYSYKLNDAIMNNQTEENSQSQPISMDKSMQDRHRNSLKMNIYLLTQFAEHFLAQFTRQNMENNLSATGRGKKNISKPKNSLDVQCDIECERLLRLLIKFMDLRINVLWENHIIEDDFVNTVANFGYKILENEVLIKMKSLRENVFHLLGYFTKKYNQSLSVSLKIVQMLQHFENLAVPLAEATALWHETYKCKTIVAEVLRELGYIQERELLRDSVVSKAVSAYLTEMGKILPLPMMQNVSLIVGRLNEEAYMLRNSVLSVMGDAVAQCLTKEGLDENAKSTRDQFLEHLYDHAYLDPNAFVRCKAVHVWLSLVKEHAVPLKSYPQLVQLASELLMDKSNLVRKATIQLLQALLTWNPFAHKLSQQDLENSLEENKNKLEELRKQISDSQPQTPPDEVKTQENEKEKSEEESSESSENNINEEENSKKSNEPISQDEAVTTTIVSTDKNIEPELLAEITKHTAAIAYLVDAIKFIQQFQAIVPVLCSKHLQSKTQSDVIETIHFFTVTSKFNLEFTFIGVLKMLEQIARDDAKIKECVVDAYKDLYFSPESESAREKAEIVADNLMKLGSEFSLTQLSCLQTLLSHLDKSGDLPHGLIQTLWQRFISPETNNSKSIEEIPPLEQQKLAIKLLGMMGRTSKALLRKHLDDLVSIGFQDVVKIQPEEMLHHPADFSLATNVCKCLQTLKIKSGGAGKYTKAFRMETNHPAFVKVPQLLIAGFSHISTNWEHFAMEAIGLIYTLCKDPIQVTTKLIWELNDIFVEHQDMKRNNYMLSRLLLVLGHVALKELIYWDVDVLSELKRRRKEQDEKQEEENKKKNKEKRKSSRRQSRKSMNKDGEENLEEEMGLGGATADDAEQEFIKNITENETVSPGTVLGHFIPLIAKICLAPVDPDNPQSVAVLANAAETLAKYMLVSSKFCEDHLQLLFTLLEKAPPEVVRSNLVIPISDMCVRFPNLLEPWTSHLYARLKDEAWMVRLYTLKVLRHLILKDMIKVKGYVSEMAWCIVDKNEDIALLARSFFQELSLKGNAVYNVLPDIISRLSDSEIGMSDDSQFRVVMKFLFLFIKKEKHAESLVEKLCHRLGATRSERQWCDISYCLSLLPFTEKSFRKMQANFTCFADKLSNKLVHEAFISIITKLKKGAKEEFKIQIEELEILINECHMKGVSDEQTASKAASVVKKTRKPHSMKSPRSSVAWCGGDPGEKLVSEKVDGESQRPPLLDLDKIQEEYFSPKPNRRLTIKTDFLKPRTSKTPSKNTPSKRSVSPKKTPTNLQNTKAVASREIFPLQSNGNIPSEPATPNNINNQPETVQFSLISPVIETVNRDSPILRNQENTKNSGKNTPKEHPKQNRIATRVPYPSSGVSEANSSLNLNECLIDRSRTLRVMLTRVDEKPLQNQNEKNPKVYLKRVELDGFYPLCLQKELIGHEHCLCCASANFCCHSPWTTNTF